MEDYLPESICRTCLRRSDELTSLHSKDDDTGLTLLEKLRFCASMQVPVSERTPSNACTPCVRCITEYYDFKRRCEQSEKTLKELCAEPSECMVPKIKDFFEENYVVTKTEPDDSNSMCDDGSDLTPILEEVDGAQIAKDDEGRSESNSKFACKIEESIPSSSESPVNLDNHFKQDSYDVSDLERKSEDDRLTHMPFCVEDETNNIFGPDQLDDPKEKDNNACDMCPQSFPTDKHLRRHKMLSHSARRHRCNQCGASYPQAYRLHRHMKIHKEDSKYICKTCGKMFKSAQWLQTHIREHHTAEKPVYKCRVCDKTYNFICSLKAHERTHKPRKRKLNLPGVIFKCDICKKTFKTKLDLGKHIRRHLERKRQCDGCKEVFDSLSEMLEHRTIAHPDLHPYVDKVSENQPSCDVCKRTFSSRSCLQRHLRLHSAKQLKSKTAEVLKERSNSDVTQHDSEDKKLSPGQLDDFKRHKDCSKYLCETCGKAYRFVKSLRIHIAENHAAEKPIYACKVCGKIYNLISHLNAHRRTHKLSAIEFKCDICEETLMTKSDLQKHVCGHLVRKRQCDGCNEVFDSLPDMLEHRTSAHPDLDPFVEEDKKLSPGQLDDLKRHKYLCETCGKAYRFVKSLRIHIAENHAAEKPIYACKVCGKTYNLISHLNAHRRTHKLSAIEFKCDICEETLKTKRDLRKHVCGHLVRKRQCDGCNEVFDSFPDMLEHRTSAHPDLDPFVDEEKKITPGQVNDPKEKLKHSCDECSRSFSTVRSLKRHKTLCHSYSCDACDKRFAIEVDLLKHKEYHVTEMAKPYACTLCEKRFSTTWAVSFHVSTLHHGKKHLKCDVCGMEFYNRFHYAAHYSSHTGIKPYLCDGCGLGYNYKKDMKNHQKRCASLLELAKQ